MAKVTGPLHSDTATGTFNDSLTFDKRGFVRVRVIPANPQTGDQGNVRQKLLAVQKALSVLGNTPITALKALAPISYRWNSFALQQAIGPLEVNYDAAAAAFDALTTQQKTDWGTQAANVGILQQQITYATDSAVVAGKALFVVCAMLYALGINPAAGAPGGTNQAAWGTYFAS